MATRKARDPHPEEALATLASRLKQGPLTGVALYGDERFFKDAGARLALDVAKERKDEICRHNVVDPDFSLSRLMDDLSSGALFSSARTIHLEGAEKVLRKGAPGFSAALTARIS